MYTLHYSKKTAKNKTCFTHCTLIHSRWLCEIFKQCKFGMLYFFVFVEMALIPHMIANHHSVKDAKF